MRRPSGTSPRLRTFLAAFLAVGLIGLVLAGVAGADALTPESGPTQNAKDIDTLYKIVFVIGLAILSLVWGILFYSLFRYRARRGRVAPQVRGNAPLELGWTIGAVAVVTVIAIMTFIFLDDIKNPVASGPDGLAQARVENATLNQPPPPGGKYLRINVSGQQYFWRYQYPNGAVSFHDMVVPKDTTVTLKLSSNDVAHSWWIPKLGPKFDAIRGLTNETWFKATETGTFVGQCAEYCGTNHYAMSAKVIVVEPTQYQQWVSSKKREIQEARDAVQKQRKQLQSELG
jgi:cytochrome c oxidase subunit 2